MAVKLNQFKKNIISGSLVHGLNILIIMISYPIYIKLLGFELFSLWSLFAIVIAFALMGNFGIGKAIIVFIAMENAKKDYEEILNIISNSFYIILIASVLLIIVLYLSDSIIVNVIYKGQKYRNIALKLVPIIGFSAISLLFFDLHKSTLAGLGRIDLANIALLLLNTIKIITSVIFIYLGFSIFSIAVGIIIANFVVIMILLYKKFGLNVLKFKRPKIQNIRNLLNFGSSIIGMQITNMLGFPLIKILLSRYFDLSAVGIFELATKSSYALRRFFEKGLLAVLPEISNDFAILQRRKQISSKIKRLTNKLIMYGIPFMLIMALLAPILLKIWLGNNFNNIVLHGFWLLQPGILIGLVALPSYYALQGTKNQKYCFYESIIRTTLMIILTIAFYLLNRIMISTFIAISISVIISNSYIFYIFRKKLIYY